MATATKQMAHATLIAPPERPEPTSQPDLRRTYTCPQCGHVLRITGVGRHRVYFELDDDRLSDPVMDRVCPECGHGLPGKSAP